MQRKTKWLAATLIGVPLGFLIGSSRYAARALEGTLRFLQGVSGIAWLPLAIIWFGFTHLTTLVVVVYTLVQGATLPWLAGRLRVTAGDRLQGLDLEAAPLERVGADVLTVHVPADSRLHGVEVFELRLPRGAGVALIVRDGASLSH